MNPFQAAAKHLVAKEHKQVAAEALSWYGDRGWSLITGDDTTTHPQTFKDLVVRGARGNGVVAACARVIISAMSEAPLHGYAEGASIDEIEQNWDPLARDHPMEELLEYPNLRDSRLTLVARKTAHFLYAGNAFEWKKRNGAGLVEEIKLIRPDRVLRAGLDADDNVTHYVIQMDSKGRTKNIPASDIIHTPDIDPMNEVFGMPRLMAVGSDIVTDNYASQYVREILSNHGNPGLVIGVDPATRAERITEAEARWEEKFGPGQGRGKVGFIPGAHTIREIGFSLQELEFPDLRNVTRESICAVFGVDPLYVGIGSAARGSTLSGAEQEEARKKLWAGTIVPLLVLFEQQLNRHLATEFGEGIGIFFDTSKITALQEDRNAAVDRAVKLKDVGGFSLPEIRAEAGMPPELPEDTVVLQSTGTVAVPSTDLLDPEAARQRRMDEAAALAAEAEGGGEEEEEEEEEEAALRPQLNGKRRRSFNRLVGM